MTTGPGNEGPANWPAQGTTAPPPGYPPNYQGQANYPGQGGFPGQGGYPGQANYPNQGYAPPPQYGNPIPQNPYPTPPKKKSKAGWIISGLLVVVLIAAGAGYFVLHKSSSKNDQAGSGGNMPTATLKQAWSTSDTHDNLVGLWQTAHSVVRIGDSGAAGYDLSSGRKLFTIAPPAAGLVPCSASPTLAPGGVGAIFYSKDGNFSCDSVIGVDANTGKQLWVLHSENKVADAATGSTFVDGSVVVVASDSDAVAGVDAATGNTVWTYSATAKNCSPQNTGGMGSVVIVQEHCEGGGQTGVGNYVAVDAATGKHLWQTPTAPDYRMRAVISTNPVVILAASSKSTLVGNDLKDGAEFLAFDGGGKQTATIPADDNQAGTTLTTPHPNALVAGTTLYADAKSANGSEGVTAYNVTTGAKLWSYQATFESMALTDLWLTGLAPDSSPLVVIDLHSLGNACPVEKLDPATGKPSQQYVLADNVDPDSGTLVQTAAGTYVLAPQNPQVGPGLTVMTPK
ncbi:outer membrane protein assembly factor BamB [Catenulispora sp. GP43]|uniref:outer membrane protein assembly factor BamB family protein n=1 Tax=Catenulispora sp. GP43 TaxID=3156263 RepID=UPI003515CF76